MSDAGLEPFRRLWAMQSALLDSSTDEWAERHLTDESLREVFTEDVVWDASGVEILGFAQFTGYDGLRRFWNAWLDSWERMDWRIADVRLTADRAVAWVEDHRMTGRASGARVELPPYAWIVTARDGRVTHVGFALDREAAYAAARDDS